MQLKGTPKIVINVHSNDKVAIQKTSIHVDDKVKKEQNYTSHYSKPLVYVNRFSQFNYVKGHVPNTVNDYYIKDLKSQSDYQDLLMVYVIKNQ